MVIPIFNEEPPSQYNLPTVGVTVATVLNCNESGEPHAPVIVGELDKTIFPDPVVGLDDARVN